MDDVVGFTFDWSVIMIDLLRPSFFLSTEIFSNFIFVIKTLTCWHTFRLNIYFLVASFALVIIMKCPQALTILSQVFISILHLAFPVSMVWVTESFKGKRQLTKILIASGCMRWKMYTWQTKKQTFIFTYIDYKKNI